MDDDGPRALGAVGASAVAAGGHEGGRGRAESGLLLGAVGLAAQQVKIYFEVYIPRATFFFFFFLFCRKMK